MKFHRDGISSDLSEAVLYAEATRSLFFLCVFSLQDAFYLPSRMLLEDCQLANCVLEFKKVLIVFCS